MMNHTTSCLKQTRCCTAIIQTHRTGGQEDHKLSPPPLIYHTSLRRDWPPVASHYRVKGHQMERGSYNVKVYFFFFFQKHFLTQGIGMRALPPELKPDPKVYNQCNTMQKQQDNMSLFILVCEKVSSGLSCPVCSVFIWPVMKHASAGPCCYHRLR